MFITESDGKQIGRNDKLLGAIGTSKILLTPFKTTGPPADRAYAVEPVGVDTSIPSPDVVVNNYLFTYISRAILLQSFLVIAISFNITFLSFPS